jgi:hypothetical protein
MAQVIRRIKLAYRMTREISRWTEAGDPGAGSRVS